MRRVYACDLAHSGAPRRRPASCRAVGPGIARDVKLARGGTEAEPKLSQQCGTVVNLVKIRSIEACINTGLYGPSIRYRRGQMLA